MSEIEISIDDTTAPVSASLSGSLDCETVSTVFSRLKPYFDKGEPLSINVGGISEIDSAGVAFFAYGFSKLGTGPQGCSLSSVRSEVANALKLTGWDFSVSDMSMGLQKVGSAEAMGATAEAASHSFYYFLFLLSEIFYHAIVTPFKGQKPRVKIFIEQMARLGAGSAPIVLLVALLVGLTTAFQSAYELRQFGANIYVADVISISMMCELGPLMAAILVAGRSGAAITAEIGTMKVSEEIDAMTLIGINPIQYLAVPRIYAVVITQALLGVTAAVVGIMGGLVIAISYLDLSIAAFVNQSLQALVVGDVFHNLSKSSVFGFIIVSVGVFHGLQVTGGAEGVGKATTSSVVSSIFLIIVTDCIYSFM